MNQPNQEIEEELIKEFDDYFYEKVMTNPNFKIALVSGDEKRHITKVCKEWIKKAYRLGQITGLKRGKELLHNHYWDSFEKDKELLFKHFDGAFNQELKLLKGE